MKNKKHRYSVWFLCWLMAVCFVTAVIAQDDFDDFGGDDFGDSSSDSFSDSSATSSSSDGGIKKFVEDYVFTESYYGKIEYVDKDPFLPLEQFWPPPPRQPKKTNPNQNRPTQPRNTEPAKPVVKEIQVSVGMIVGNDSKRIAFLSFEGKEDAFEVGQEVPNAFKVRAIKDNEVEIYSYRTNNIKKIAIQDK